MPRNLDLKCSSKIPSLDRSDSIESFKFTGISYKNKIRFADGTNVSFALHIEWNAIRTGYYPPQLRMEGLSMPTLYPLSVCCVQDPIMTASLFAFSVLG